MMADRNTGVELYRTLLMLGICALHAAARCPSGNSYLSRMLEPCVDGFVFISGYYGVRFSWGRVMRLYAYAFACALISVLLEPIVLGGMQHPSIVKGVFSQIQDYWFVHAYVFMMLFAPVLNEASGRALVPIVVSVFGWSFFASFRCTQAIIPMTAGLSAFSGVTLIGIYAFARLCRNVDFRGIWKHYYMLPIVAVLLCLSGLGLGRYNSPLAAALAALGFYGFSGLSSLGDGMSRLLRYLGPSLFAVYLIQTTTCGFLWMESTTMHWALVTVVLFIGCLLADMPRRMAVALIRQCWRVKCLRDESR